MVAAPPRPIALLGLAALASPAALTAGCASAPATTAPGYVARTAEAGPDGEEPLQVAFLLVDGVYNTELTAPFDVFHHTIFRRRPGMRVFTVAPHAGPVVTFEGLRILPDHTFEDAPPIDVLVVPSGEHSMDADLEDARLLDWVRRTGRGAELVVSLCDGAFVLAGAGLLDGLAATTFPGDLDPFEERFPAVRVQHDVSFVHDGRAVTSAGGALSFEPALYVAELYYGAEAARRIGRGLCIEWDRDTVACVVAAGAQVPAPLPPSPAAR